MASTSGLQSEPMTALCQACSISSHFKAASSAAFPPNRRRRLFLLFLLFVYFFLFIKKIVLIFFSLPKMMNRSTK